MKLWDANTGELNFNVDRKSFFSKQKSLEAGPDSEEHFSLFESGSPKLLNKINTDFSYNSTSYGTSPTKSDFERSYRYFYSNHNYGEKLKQKDDENRINCQSDSIKCKSKDFSRTKCDLDKNCFNHSDNSELSSFTRQSSDCDKFSDFGISSIWCIDYLDDLIVAGCADGRLEFWEVNTHKLKVN